MSIKHIVIAPDSFKESMSAKQASIAIKEGFERVFNNTVHYELIPMADGGEGTTAALVEALNADWRYIRVRDPLSRPIMAGYAITPNKDTAIIEMAAASGLHLVQASERNPLITSTIGTGDIILDALNQGVKRIILGIGGSATNDGGAGMLTALGVQFLDNNHQILPQGGGALAQLSKIDSTNLDKRLAKVTFKVACDVTNPLLGLQGASVVYGPQKGATEKMIPKLDSALANYHDKIKIALNKDVKDIPGAGAAGGLGTGLLAFCQVTMMKGIDLVLEETQFKSYAAQANLVITGEGKIDGQTIYGKTPIGVAKAAKQFHCPVIAICGSLGDNYEAVYHHGIDSVFSIIEQPETLDHLLEHGYDNMVKTAENIARLIKLSSSFQLLIKQNN
ncbi:MULTISPECIES: glycerate kinase [Staphylococcus]|uniref:glycerate kinase n=1 Tax=Staphylococcus TaxID=1279 RepID=UPI0008A5D132|nr:MULTISPECIES: glycerate kinase [Staphylococcus]ARB77022.1 glycerate kinase [Staphylococcus lugdunensis]ARJ18072.1 glycerate kinase [Staphylococcus lugdunensis]MBM7134644.1 glycerate kinase [Staphylococcus lugdunensis]MCH8642946.1 glycerate kinase [Staphylococcus lugdunensis]MCH8645264.1 glycerate kinase [Staphylococcus lugdunensis]